MHIYPDRDDIWSLRQRGAALFERISFRSAKRLPAILTDMMNTNGDRNNG